MGRAEYAMIRSALEETARKIRAREESIERQREKLLAEEDTVKRGKMMEQIDRERRAVERERKLLKALEEKAVQTRTGRRPKERARRKRILKTARKSNQLLKLIGRKREKREGKKKAGKLTAADRKERKPEQLKGRQKKKRTNLPKEKLLKRKGSKTAKRVKRQAPREE